MIKTRPIIAVDGPAAAGKSTVSKLLARRLGFQYFDTGALYRSVGLAAIEAGIDPQDGAAVAALCRKLDISMSGPPNTLQVTLNNRNITDLIRGEKIGEAASVVSANSQVRQALLPLQRRWGKNGGVVMDGRDIGTVIFPDAEIKIYLDAALPVRADRRAFELQEPVGSGQMIETIRLRDSRDSTRSYAPLRKAPDAFYLDTSTLTINQVVNTILTRFDPLLKGD